MKFKKSYPERRIARPSDERSRSAPSLPDIGLRIDWDLSPNLLLAGDLSALDPRDAAVIEGVAKQREFIALAQQMNVSPTMLVVALLALSQTANNRSAARIAKAILGDRLPDAKLVEVAVLLGID